MFKITKKDDSMYRRVASNYTDVYVHQTKIPARLLLSSPQMHVWILEGLSHSARFFVTRDFKESHARSALYFVAIPWFHDSNYYRRSISFICDLAPSIDPGQIIVLANSPAEVEFAKSAGMSSSFLCHQNAWLDWNLFSIDESAEKKYDLVLNTRPESWKRPFLANKVQRLAIIKGNNYRKDDYYDLNQLNPVFINTQRISPAKVCQVLNQSCAGGIFSALEGGCYSSSEYLLCGIPVISTPSQGGRDVWYNDSNSIVLRNISSEDVVEAVDQIKAGLSLGAYTSAAIRRQHIDLQAFFRNCWIQFVKDQCDLHHVTLDVDAWFSSIYQNKMVAYNDYVVLDGDGKEALHDLNS